MPAPKGHPSYRPAPVHIAQILLLLPPELKARIQTAAKASNTNVNEWLRKAAEEKLATSP